MTKRRNRKPALSRREMLNLSAKGAITAGFGLNMFGMAGAMLPGLDPLAGLKKTLLSGEPSAMAHAGCVAGSTPMIQITLIDKIQHALLMEVPGTAAAGDLNGLDGTGQAYQGIALDGKALPANVVDWRGMRLTTLFSEWLAGFNPNSNMAIVSRVTSQAGGHNLMSTDISSDIGGLNYAKLADTSNLGPGAQLSQQEIDFYGGIRDVLESNGCIGCHGGYGDFEAAWDDREMILNRINRDPTDPMYMPQGGAPFDTPENRDALVSWLTSG